MIKWINYMYILGTTWLVNFNYWVITVLTPFPGMIHLQMTSVFAGRIHTIVLGETMLPPSNNHLNIMILGSDLPWWKQTSKLHMAPFSHHN